jgi:hypothetical protein
MSPFTEPTPLVQVAVYMGGILAGYVLLTTPEEWRRAWAAVREVVRSADSDRH